MAAHCYNPGTQEAEKEDSEFEASLGNTTRLSQKKKIAFNTHSLPSCIA